ncbi:hypothetical protein FB451DRAFT_1171019 [Mycena latifolia]|nr:hypothetical protein FB451DRAFT_1171019 [Mycena latifolia]
MELFSCVFNHIHSNSDLLSLCLVSRSLYEIAVRVLYEHIASHPSQSVEQFWWTLFKQKGAASKVLSLELSLMDEDYYRFGVNAIWLLLKLKATLSQLTNVRKLSICAPGFPGSYLPDCTLPRLVDFAHVEFLERHRHQIRTLSLVVLPPPSGSKSTLKRSDRCRTFPTSQSWNGVLRWNRVPVQRIHRRPGAWLKSLFVDMAREFHGLRSLSISISIQMKNKYTMVNVIGISGALRVSDFACLAALGRLPRKPRGLCMSRIPVHFRGYSDSSRPLPRTNWTKSSIAMSRNGLNCVPRSPGCYAWKRTNF